MTSWSRALVLVAVLALAPLAGCGDPDPEYTGAPGTTVPLALHEWVPIVSATRAGQRHELFLDTGSPLTFVTPPPAGSEAAPLAVLGVQLPASRVVALQVFAPEPDCQPLPATGLLGGNILDLFRLRLDYRARQAVVFDGAQADTPLASAVGAPVTLAVTVVGGGNVPTVVGDVRAGPTRVLVEVLVEGRPEVALLDTGASLTVVGRELLRLLPLPQRPTLCCDKVTSAYGPLKTERSRLRELRLGTAVLQNVPVMVIEDSAFLRPLSAEVGSTVRLMIGGSALRHFAFTVDYPRRTLVLARFLQQDHVPVDEHVGPGFSLCPAKTASGFVVVQVYAGTDAAPQVRSGERLIAVDGQSVAGLDLEELQARWRRAGVGSRTTLRFAGPPETERSVLVERLLPDLLPP